MRKFALTLALAGLALFATGCMITEYPDTTDNDSRAGGQTEDPLAVQVATSGAFHIIESGQTATDNNGDGVYTFIGASGQQAASADGTFQDKEIGNWPQSSRLPYTFHSDLYGNSNHTGCPRYESVAEFDPVTGSPINTFDYSTNDNCGDVAADADLSVLVSYFTRTFEAGNELRMFPNLAGTGVSDAEVLDLLANAEPSKDLGGNYLKLPVTGADFQDVVVTVSALGSNDFVTVPVNLPASLNFAVYVDAEEFRQPKLLPIINHEANAEVFSYLSNLLDDARALVGSDRLQVRDVQGTFKGIQVDGMPERVGIVLPETLGSNWDFGTARNDSPFGGETRLRR